MKLNRNFVVIAALTVLVILVYSLLNLYLYFYPLSTVSLESLNLNEVETNINVEKINELNNFF